MVAMRAASWESMRVVPSAASKANLKAVWWGWMMAARKVVCSVEHSVE
jgi:hypothetical protein